MMKNLTKIFMAVAVALFAFACSTDTTEDLGVNVAGQTTLTVSLEESRTHLGDKAGSTYPLYWSEGDAISVNGVASAALTKGGSAEATFTFKGALNYPYNILYPASTTGNVTFLAEQTYTEGTFCAGAAPMCGYVEEGDPIELYHLVGALRFAPYGQGVTLSSLTVSSESSPLAGTYAVDFTTGALTAQEGKTSNKVTLSFGEGLALSDDANSAVPVYVAVPAGAHGMVTVTLYSTDGKKMVAKFDSEEKPVAAGYVREFKPFEFMGTLNDDPFEINSKETLIAFAKNPTPAAKVTANIDMTGYDWTPIDYTGAFSFDGGNYEIKGLNAPLFGVLSAPDPEEETEGGAAVATTTLKNAISIKDVKLVNVNINETAKTTIGALACDIQDLEAEVTNCSVSGKMSVNIEQAPATAIGYMAGIVATTTSTMSFTDLESDVDITVRGNYTLKVYVCGCVASMNDAILSDATNLGNIDVEVSVSDKTDANGGLFIAGVAGRCKYASDCTNGMENDKKKGKIVVNGALKGDLCCTGAVYHMYEKTDVQRVVNYGDIELTGTCNNVYASGALSSYSKNTITTTDCHNHGDITVDLGTTGGIYVAGFHTKLLYANCVFSGCSNTGHFTINRNAIEDVNDQNLYVGGITSNFSTITLTLTNCSNSGNFTISGNYSNCYVGGAVEKHNYTHAKTAAITFESFTNSGSINFTEETVASGFIYASGFVGLVQKSSGVPILNISGKSSNSASISIKGSANHVYAAGVAALYASSTLNISGEFTNSGAISSEATVGSASNSCCLGGVIGYSYGSSVINITGKASNSGSISINETSCSGYAGGLISRVEGTTNVSVDGFTNSGAILLNLTGGYPAGGGLIGSFKTNDGGKFTIKNSSNSGNVTTEGAPSSASLYIGGIIGTIPNGAVTTGSLLENCTNSATIKSDISTNRDLYVGGIIGLSYHSLTMTGDIINDTNAKVIVGNDGQQSKAGSVRVGGIIGALWNSNAVITTTEANIYHKGEVKIDKSVNSARVQTAGFLGYTNASKVASDAASVFTNSGKVGFYGDCTGITLSNIDVGGVIGIAHQFKEVNETKIKKVVDKATIECYAKVDEAQISKVAIGGVIGRAVSYSLSNADCDCNIIAYMWDEATSNSTPYSNVGMLVSNAYAAATKATNCQVRGSICKGKKVNEDDGSFDLTNDVKNLTPEKYVDYIYSDAIDKGTASTDNVTYWERNN